jgi:hypothetical protein
VGFDGMQQHPLPMGHGTLGAVSLGGEGERSQSAERYVSEGRDLGRLPLLCISVLVHLVHTHCIQRPIAYVASACS